jgi:hypothetical protein
MTKKPCNKGYKILLHDYAEAVSMNSQVATEFLENEGIDVSKYVAQGLKSIRKTSFVLKAEANMERDKDLMERALNLLKQKINENIEKSSEVLQNLLRERAPEVQFRSLESLDSEEIIEILNDVDLVAMIEDLEKEDEGQ